MSTYGTEQTPLVSLTRPSTPASNKKGTRGVLLTVAGLALLGTLLLVAQEPTANIQDQVSVGEVQNNVAQEAMHHESNVVQEEGEEEEEEEDFFCGITNQETGYIQLPNKLDDHYFYWYVESRNEPSTDPLVLWLTGGPGCSSMMALLTENGPCRVHPDLTTEVNEFSWNNEANVLWLDQPTGVGYSYGKNSDYDHTETDVGENIYWFLQEFFKLHPDLADRPFFVTGESYGGKYVPAAAGYIAKQNLMRLLDDDTTFVHLHGIAIGNGITNPPVQYLHQTEMTHNAYNVSLVSEEQLEDMKLAEPVCHEMAAECQTDHSKCPEAAEFCMKVQEPYFTCGRNPYDLREECHEEDLLKCFGFEHIDAFLNSDKVLKELGIDTKHSQAWRECDYRVNADFSGDALISQADNVLFLLDVGVRVLIYAGDADLMCNWVGNKAWTMDMDWIGKPFYNAAEDRPFMTKAVGNAGEVRSFANLAFLRIYDAGHMVPMNQPAVSLEMINTFLRGDDY